MRILHFLIFFIFLSIFIGGIGFFVAREGLLIWSTTEVKSSLAELQLIAHNPTAYISQCREKGSREITQPIQRLQLRFTDSTHYVLEVLCAEFPLDPIVVDTRALPMFVQKVPGTSGILWGDDKSGIELNVFGAKEDVYVSSRAISTDSPHLTTLGVGPQTTCGGYGYMCCQPETQQGIQNVFDQASDCPRSCYVACSPRPVVLSFTSDPVADTATRTITIKSGDSVTLSYVASSVSDPKKNLAVVTLNYGDGKSEHFTQLNTQQTHIYTCGGPQCSYAVQLSVQDGTASSADTPISRLQVLVTQ